MSSDVDLVVLTDETEPYVAGAEWIRAATGQGEGRIIRTRKWGPLTERRVELTSGLLIEYGFAPVAWARTDRLDPGTARVVIDGFRILHDPDGVLERVAARVQEVTEADRRGIPDTWHAIRDNTETTR